MTQPSFLFIIPVLILYTLSYLLFPMQMVQLPLHGHLLKPVLSKRLIQHNRHRV